MGNTKRICSRCGSENDDKAGFCSQCGSPLEITAVPNEDALPSAEVRECIVPSFLQKSAQFVLILSVLVVMLAVLGIVWRIPWLSGPPGTSYKHLMIEIEDTLYFYPPLFLLLAAFAIFPIVSMTFSPRKGKMSFREFREAQKNMTHTVLIKKKLLKTKILFSAASFALISVMAIVNILNISRLSGFSNEMGVYIVLAAGILGTITSLLTWPTTRGKVITVDRQGRVCQG